MSRGRPPTTRTIVNVNDILLVPQFIAENPTITHLAQSMSNYVGMYSMVCTSSIDAEFIHFISL